MSSTFSKRISTRKSKNKANQLLNIFDRIIESESCQKLLMKTGFFKKKLKNFIYKYI